MKTQPWTLGEKKAGAITNCHRHCSHASLLTSDGFSHSQVPRVALGCPDISRLATSRWDKGDIPVCSSSAMTIIKGTGQEVQAWGLYWTLETVDELVPSSPRCCSAL